MDNLQYLKSLVRTSRNSGHDYGLTYAQHLDVASRLLYGAESLNHFSANPELYASDNSRPTSITDILTRLQKAESLIKQTVPEPIPDYERLEKWMFGAEIWLDSLDESWTEPALLALLRESHDIDNIRLPGVIKRDGTVGSLLDPESPLPALEQLRFIIQGWLPNHAAQVTGDEGMLIQYWDALEKVARHAGLNKDDAHYYRSICRESFNHTWSVQSMIALGLLDIDITVGSFFLRHPSPVDAVTTMQSIWEYEEPGWDD